jgi:GNAT superfamily N-acetyltransferase
MEQLQSRIKERARINLALLHQGKMVGWSYGWQESVHAGDFYMAGSLVLPEHRRQGFYSALVRKLLDLSQQEGFSAVRSRHICTNNAVLIAKLKLGFTINGFEQDEIMGTLVRVIYHHDPLRRKAVLFRAGKVGESEVLAHLSAQI